MNEIVICDPLPDSHRPVETCAVCKQPWPCPTEQLRIDALLIADRFRDVPPTSSVGEKKMGTQ